MNDRTLKRLGMACIAILSALPLLRAAASEPVRSMEIIESSAFLEGYRAASTAQSADFYDLYSDRAVIHVRVQDHEQGMAFQGRAYKAWGREQLRQGRTGLDGSIFHEPTVEQRGGRLLIRAKRYSTTRCYWDVNYQVGIEREGSAYRIVDERLTTQPNAHCSGEHASGASPNIAMLSWSELSPARSIDNVRVADVENSPRWHPLSQQELTDKAMQLAQQMAAARAAQSRAGGVAPLPAAAGRDSPSTASVRRADASADLRVTPEE